MLTLDLYRKKSQPWGTLGELRYRGGEHLCWTLEDIVREIPGRPVREWKIDGETAIPAGTYMIVYVWSPKHQCNMLRLLRVDGFDGILIHAGSKAADTRGCILVGLSYVLRGPLPLRQSRAALDMLTPIIVSALKRGPVQITIHPAEDAA